MNYIPADIPKEAHAVFTQNYEAITRKKNKLFLFATDQKIEHLNNDFHGDNIHENALRPEHLFEIASRGTIGAMATHPGLIARYANLYKNIYYIAKLNGKTNLIPPAQRDPMSQQLWSVNDVIRLRQQNNVPICGVGYTIYLGSEYETVMLSQAAQIINQAHQVGFVAILWIYPRGKAIANSDDPQLLAGAAGLANSLGADFVKIHAPENPESLKHIAHAAGNTQVICAGGKQQDETLFIEKVYEQMHIGNCAGAAIGRNIFQHSTEKAIALTHTLADIIYNGKTPKDALQKL